MNTEILREIPKETEPPQLSSDAIQIITELCFRTEKKRKGHCDSILIFGTSHEHDQEDLARRIQGLYLTHSPSTIYITGGRTRGELAESRMIYNLILKYGPKIGTDVGFVMDVNSRNTEENVRAAIMLGLRSHNSVLLVSKAPHTGRCYLTALKHIPKMDIRTYGYAPRVHPGAPPITRENWFLDPRVKARMWAEFLRIELYGKRGDIAYPPEVKAKVERVRELTK